MKKNILLLVLDGLRPDRMSYNGNPRQTTPFIDELIKGAKYYSNAYAPASCSLPCHISMFTGVHSHFHKAATNFSYYNNNLPFLTGELKKEGYYTSGISTYNPYMSVECGFIRYFDKYVKIVKSNAAIRTKAKKNRAKENTTKTGLLNAAKKLCKDRMRNHFFNKMSKFYLDNDLGGAKIISQLKQELDNVNENKKLPFFIFANILESHTPFLPPREYRDYFGKVKITKNLLAAFFDPHAHIDGKIKLLEQEQESMEMLYDCGLRYTDDLVKDLFDYMQDKGCLEDTLVIVLSDHSEMLNEHDRLIGHGSSTYEGMIKVPIILIDHTDPECKGVDSKYASTVDIFPTVLKAAGIGLDHDKFFYQCFNLKSLPSERMIIAECTELPFTQRLKEFPNMVSKLLHTERTIIHNEKKLIWRSDGEHKFFNLKRDSGEKENLFEKYKNTQVQQLKQKMQAWYESQMEEGEFFSLEYFPYRAKAPDVVRPDDLIVTQDEDKISLIKDVAK